MTGDAPKDNMFCWEFNDCLESDKQNCDIFQKGTGKECLFGYCPLNQCRLPGKEGGCMKCPWFSRIDFQMNVVNQMILQSIWF